MTTISCLIVDDEPNAGKLLQDHIEKVPYLDLKATCFDAMEALDFFSHSSADIVFLDINMPGLSGMELAGLLPREQKIIMTTAYSEYAIESYQFNVVDYLLKPITFRRFMMAITKVVQLNASVEKAAAAEQYLFARSDKKLIRVNFRDILYFEALREYVCIHTRGQKIITYKRMKELPDKLPGQFIRVHNSYIINGDHIGKIEGNMVLIDNKNIPIGVSYRDVFLAFIQARSL